MQIPKRKPIRHRKLLDLAHRVNHCQFRLNPCTGYMIDGCVPAHSNAYDHGHGKGQKADDDQHVASCDACHKYFDAHKLPRHWERRLFDNARKRTFDLYEQNGWLDEIGYKKAS
jgi:hypothetical protein